MLDFYKILGVDPSASHDEIKRSYRRLASQYHPDKGGTTEKFQELQAAYDTLGDEQKRQAYDRQRSGEYNTEAYTNWHDLGAMFGFRGFEEILRRQTGASIKRKNRDLNVKCTVTLKQTYLGADLEVNYKLLSGKQQTVIVTIPVGISSGQTIRYQGMGDDSDQSLPRGDLNIIIDVKPENDFYRKNNDLVVELKITALDAMVGCSKIIDLFGSKSIRIKLNPGVQPETEFVSQGLGFKSINDTIGDLIIITKVEIPQVIDPVIKQELENIYAKITNI